MNKNNLIGYRMLKNDLLSLCDECIRLDMLDLIHNYDLLDFKAGQQFEQNLENLYGRYKKQGLSQKIINLVFGSVANNRFYDMALYKGYFRGYLSIINELKYYIDKKYYY